MHCRPTMPKTARTLIPVAALTVCLLAGCSRTSISATPTVSGSPTPTAASAAPTPSGLAPSVPAAPSLTGSPTTAAVSASVSPTASSPIPSASSSADVSGSSGSASGTALTRTQATPDRAAGFQLPTGMTPVATTSAGDLVTANQIDATNMRLSVYDPAGSLVWISGPEPVLAYSLSVVGTKIYGLGVITTAASGLSTGGSKYSTVVFDTTKPKDPGVTTPTTQNVPPTLTAKAPLPEQNFVVGTRVYKFTGTDAGPYAASFSVDMLTGVVKHMTVPANTVMVAGIDRKGALITLQDPTPADGTTGLAQDTLTNGSWSMPIVNHYTYQGPPAGSAVTKMGLAADDLIGYTPAGGTSPAKTQWIDGTGKTIFTTDNIGPLVWSPNKLWVAAGDEIHNLKTKKVYRFPTAGGTAAAKFIDIDNDGVALTLGADGASVVQINTATGATKDLAPAADFSGIDRFGDWTRYKDSTVVGRNGGDVMVPPTK